MSSKKRVLTSPTSPSPLRMRTHSPALSAVRSSPLSSGPLTPYPLTASSFESSPNLSFIECHPESPDLFEPFEYTPEIGFDLSRIDLETAPPSDEDGAHTPPPTAARVLVPETPPSAARTLIPKTPPPSAARIHVPETPPPSTAQVLGPETPLSTLPQDQKTWVVFLGKVPGVYNTFLSAAKQANRFPDPFQRAYPDTPSAMAAWEAYEQDGTFPSYGKAPWVVFLGRKIGVFEKVSDLERSVKGYDGAIFRSCSSLANAQARFQLFTKRVTGMFINVTPHLDPIPLPPSPAGRESSQDIPPPGIGDNSQDASAVRSITPTPVPTQSQPAPQITEPEPLALEQEEYRTALSLSMMRRLKTPCPGETEGWYVVFHGVLPGVSHGSKELKARGPKPGGFESAFSEEAANNLFLHLATTGLLVWASD